MHKPDTHSSAQQRLWKRAMTRQDMLTKVNHNTKRYCLSNSILINSVLSCINSVLSLEYPRRRRRHVDQLSLSLSPMHNVEVRNVEQTQKINRKPWIINITHNYDGRSKTWKHLKAIVCPWTSASMVLCEHLVNILISVVKSTALLALNVFRLMSVSL